MAKAILFDVTRCIGCKACEVACKDQNHLPENDDTKLTARTWNIVQQYGELYVRRFCMHCQTPTCVSVCPVGAFVKRDDGVVLYDENKCIGCRYCMAACPFQVPKYEWDSTLPRVQKCIMCASRLQKGEQPACTEICPTAASLFGERDELLQEARQRIQANPGQYVDHIYGEKEVGGTSVIYLSNVPFAELGFDTNLTTDPLPSLTWYVLSKIPNLVSIGGVMLFGIWWIINRRITLERQRVQQEKLENAKKATAASTQIPEEVN